MPATTQARLADRGVVRVDGRDSVKLLQGIVTNNVEGLETGDACYAALLSPQGKILFDFFAVRTANGFLLDTAGAMAADLAKRLSMYKLRADVTIAQAPPDLTVVANWSDVTSANDLSVHGVAFRDPRHPLMGLRLLTKAESVDSTDDAKSYDTHRVRLGVPEGGKDYAFGDAYPHEAGFDRLNGVSFAKGCYVGQEVVARMQHKTTVRKRVVKIAADAPLASGADILLGDVAVGKIGTVDGTSALAMLRLDRAIEARDKNQPLRACDAIVSPDGEALAAYSAATAKHASASPGL